MDILGEAVNYDLATMLDAMQDALLVVSPAGVITMVNQAAQDLTGYSSRELLGSPCTILRCTGCVRYEEGEGPKWCKLFSMGQVRAKRCQMTHKNGTRVQITKRASVLKKTDGKLAGAVEVLSDISELVRMEVELASLRNSMNNPYDFQGIVGKSLLMRRLFELIKDAALSHAPVLITGESGTGKELVAGAIHNLGLFSKGPFIKTSCATLNQQILESELFGHVKGAFTGADKVRIGRFEAANGGDIFLDEIGDIPLSTQVKLLRVLQEKEIHRVGGNRAIGTDARIITATNRDLPELMRQGKFREDLFYRINVVPIRVPPLRERREDIPLLAQSFVDRLRAQTGKPIFDVTPKAVSWLCNYGWPGNVRQLKNAIEYAFVICKDRHIRRGHLGEHLETCAAPPSDSAGSEDQRRQLISVLKECGGNQSHAAKRLGVSRMTVYNRLKKYRLDINRDVLTGA